MDIQLVKRIEKDEEFVFKLFSENKIAELHADNWPDQMKKQLIGMQFSAFELAMKHEYPEAEDFIIMADSEKAGRLQLDKNENGFRVINISLLSAFQGNGIGTKILRDILTEADLSNKPVYLEVDKVNPALNLYQRLGFEIYSDDEVKYSMKYTPEKSSGN